MSSPYKILIVDDDPVARGGFEKDLAGKGHTVITAASGEDALWQVGDDRYDAVVTRMNLRGISGLEVAEEIQASQFRVPVIIIADAGTEDALKAAAAAGVAAEILRRPVSPGRPAETLDRVLRSRKPDAALQPPGEHRLHPCRALYGHCEAPQSLHGRTEVDRRRGFVEHEDLRVPNERLGQTNPLQHALGELA